ncbi:MAG: type II secretion system F family protein [Myxococcota bacterium]|nr:type II secretion system F family protein [Myxococcota bacterium]
MSPFVIAAAALVACAVVGMGAGLWFFMNPSRSARDRLEDLTHGTEVSPQAQLPDERVLKMRYAVSQVAAPTDEEELDALKRRLIQAGFRGQNNVETFSASRFALAIALPLLSLVFTGGFALVYQVLIALVVAAVGYYLPAIIVTNALQKRQEALLKTFPDALDMLVASVEAGLGLDAAFRRIANEMEDAAPLLCAELKLVNAEVSAGVPRSEALERLEFRTGLDEIGSLVNVLVQSERFGTPVARSLRVHGELVRTRRMQAAEETAAKISPKLTVAMIMFMLPCLIIILIGPAVIKVIRNLLPAIS